MPGPYPDEFRQRALRMLSEARPDHKTDHAAIKHVAAMLGVNPETLRLWNMRLDVDEGRHPGTSSEAQAEIKRLKKQIAELEKANEILRTASVLFTTSSTCAPPPRPKPTTTLASTHPWEHLSPKQPDVMFQDLGDECASGDR